MFLRYENLSKRTGKYNTNSFYVFECDRCSAEYKRLWKYQRNFIKKPLYDQDYCGNCWRWKLNNRPEYKANMSKALKKVATNPEWRANMSRACMGINKGAKNGMAKPENSAARASVSAARKEYYADPKHREEASKIMRDLWAKGKYDGVAVGQCKWFDHTDWQGNNWKLQGTWELAYAKYLDAQRIKYKAHRGRIPYVDNEGNKRNYYPDFVLVESGEIIDIKNKYHYRLNESKFDMIRKSNPDKKITLLFKKDLQELGVEL